jgi:hypothetical protein
LRSYPRVGVGLYVRACISGVKRGLGLEILYYEYVKYSRMGRGGEYHWLGSRGRMGAISDGWMVGLMT